MTRWPSKTINGQIYELGHLDPFSLEVTPKAEASPTFRVRVSFGSHTFTRSWEDGDPIDQRYNDGRDQRCFCPLRYTHSLHAPGIITDAAGHKVHFSHNHNFLVARDLPGLNGPYVLFFNVRKARATGFDVALFVVSAYVKPALPKRLDSITFATLVSNVARNKRVLRPRKK